jgi:hypothetical protein
VGAPFRYDRAFVLDLPPGEVWALLQHTDRYVDWWSWLQTLDGGGLQVGDVAACVVRAPLPYSLSFTVRVEEVVPDTSVVTTVAGDLEGPARLDLAPVSVDGAPTRCEARLSWELHLRDRLLRPLSGVARPAMKWAHDRVVEVGLAEFRRRAIDGHGRP